MSVRIAFAALAAAALSAAPAAAQRPAANDVVRADAPAAAASRVVASYRMNARGTGLPAQVTVVDSMGQLVASFRAAGSRQEQPMTVMIIGTDLVLQGQTADGVLTLVLGRQNDTDPTAGVTGRWSIADRQGALRGKPRG
jgi:hypothetical protein